MAAIESEGIKMGVPCKGLDSTGYWWGGDVIDPSEPEFESGKGVFIPEPRRCRNVANESTGMCPKHEAIAKLPRCRKCTQHAGHDNPCVTEHGRIV